MLNMCRWKSRGNKTTDSTNYTSSEAATAPTISVYEDQRPIAKRHSGEPFPVVSKEPHQHQINFTRVATSDITIRLLCFICSMDGDEPWRDCTASLRKMLLINHQLYSKCALWSHALDKSVCYDEIVNRLALRTQT